MARHHLFKALLSWWVALHNSMVTLALFSFPGTHVTERNDDFRYSIADLEVVIGMCIKMLTSHIGMSRRGLPSTRVNAGCCHSFLASRVEFIYSEYTNQTPLWCSSWLSRSGCNWEIFLYPKVTGSIPVEVMYMIFFFFVADIPGPHPQ